MTPVKHPDMQSGTQFEIIRLPCDHLIANLDRGEHVVHERKGEHSACIVDPFREEQFSQHRYMAVVLVAHRCQEVLELVYIERHRLGRVV